MVSARGGGGRGGEFELYVVVSLIGRYCSRAQGCTTIVCICCEEDCVLRGRLGEGVFFTFSLHSGVRRFSIGRKRAGMWRCGAGCVQSAAVVTTYRVVQCNVGR